MEGCSPQNVLLAFYEGSERLLRSQFDGLRSHPSKHPSIRGQYLESFVSSFLTNVLPDHVGISAGTVISSTGQLMEQSRQHDIIVYDKTVPSFRVDPHNGIFLAEGVIACLEVKTRIDLPAIRQASSAATMLKGMPRNYGSGLGFESPAHDPSRYARPLYFLVGSEGAGCRSISNDYISKSLIDAVVIPCSLNVSHSDLTFRAKNAYHQTLLTSSDPVGMGIIALNISTWAAHRGCRNFSLAPYFSE